MPKKNKSRWIARAQQNPVRNEPEQGAPFLPMSVMPISPTKLEANRLNSLLSTGPATEAGKEIVSQNATKHGLTGKFRVLASESQAEFDDILAAYLRSEGPVGEDEIAMVHQMVECVWLSRRSVRMQNDCWAILEEGTEEEPRAAHKSLALYLRYQTAHDRAFTRYATELRKRRNERARVQRGFVSQKHKEAAENRRQEMHEARRALQNVKLAVQEVRNRIAAAKAQAIEFKNLARRTQNVPQTSEHAIAAAA